MNGGDMPRDFHGLHGKVMDCITKDNHKIPKKASVHYFYISKDIDCHIPEKRAWTFLYILDNLAKDSFRG
jgi:hypothetical protein